MKRPPIGEDIQPRYRANAFSCPHCGIASAQHWSQVNVNGNLGVGEPTHVSLCGTCQRFSLWVGVDMVYPDKPVAPAPNEDLPEEIKRDYEEARTILLRSPRGAAALLRLCIQKLCKHLGQPGKNINDDIKELVKKGLPPMIQQAIDLLRIVGNNAVHPGELDLRDDVGTARQMFVLVNLIADSQITQPKSVQAMYDGLLTQAQKDQITQRDGSK